MQENTWELRENKQIQRGEEEDEGEERQDGGGGLNREREREAEAAAVEAMLSPGRRQGKRVPLYTSVEHHYDRAARTLSKFNLIARWIHVTTTFEFSEEPVA